MSGAPFGLPRRTVPISRIQAAEALEDRSLLSSNVLIVAGAGSSNIVKSTVANVTTYSPNADGASIGADEIAAELAVGNSVVVETVNAGGTEDGDIDVQSSVVSVLALGPVGLTLQADNDVLLTGGAGIETTVNELTLVLTADADASSAGGISISAGSALSANGGDITFASDMLALVAGATVESSGGVLTIEPRTAGTTIGVGDTASGVLNLDPVELATLTPGFSAIQIGNSTAGVIDLNASSFSDDVQLTGTSISITGLTAAGRSVRLVTTAGGVTDGNTSGDDVTASDLEVTLTGGGFGSSADPIETVISHVEATMNDPGTASGFFLSNPGSLTIGGIGATDGISSNANGAIELSGSAVIVGEAVVSTGTSNVTLTALATLTVNAAVQTAGSVSLSGSGGVTISSTGSVTSGGGALTIDADSANGGVGVFQADAGATLDGTGHQISITAADLVLNSGSNSITSGAAADVLLIPKQTTRTIGVGDGRTGAFNLTDAELETFNVFNRVIIGRATHTGAAEIGSFDIASKTFGLKLSMGANAGASVATVSAALLAGSGGFSIDPPDNVVVNAAIDSSGPVSLAANVSIDLNATVSTTAGTAAGITLNAPTIRAGIAADPDLATDGGTVTVTGTAVIDAGTTLKIDTESGNNTSAGAVDFDAAVVSASGANGNFSVDTSTGSSSTSGKIRIDGTSSAGGALPSDVTLNATNPGSAAGNIVLFNSNTFDGNFDADGGRFYVGLDPSPSVAASGTVIANGSSTIQIDVSTNVLVYTNSTIQTAGGDLTINAHQAGTPIDQNFIGVLLLGTVQTVGDGDVAITGSGGSAASEAYGIELRSAGQVRSTSTALTAGSVTLTGHGGTSNGGIFTFGVYANSSSFVDSQVGAIVIDGTGGAGGQSHGIFLAGGDVKSLASAPITMTGQGGSGAASSGIATNGSVLITSSTASIELTGTGGAAFSSGIEMTAGSVVGASSTGTLTLNAYDTGGSTSKPGLRVSSSTIGNATATGEITLNTNLITFELNPTIVGTGALTIQPVTASSNVEVGGTGSATALSLSKLELAEIEDGFSLIAIGDSVNGSGAVTVLDSVFLDNVAIYGGTISVTQLDATGQTVTLGALTGGMTDGGDLATDVTATTVNLAASGNVGASGNAISISDGTDLNYDTASGAFNGFLETPGAVDVLSLDTGTGTLTIAAGAYHLDDPAGSKNAIAENGGTVGGIGAIDGTLTAQSGGTVAPGTSPGVLTVADAVFNDGSTFEVEIGGNTAGNTATDHDQLVATNSVTINGSVTLSLAAFNGYTPTIGDTLVIIDNQGADPGAGIQSGTTGVFDGFPDQFRILGFLGSTVDAIVDYDGGDGNDVVITVVAPEISIVTLDSVKVEGDSGSTPFTFTVSITTAQTTDVTLDYTINAPGGAGFADAADFVGGTLTGMVTIPMNATSATLTINVQGDTAAEGFEDFSVTLSNPPVGIAVSATNDTASGTIQPDDFADTYADDDFGAFAFGFDWDGAGPAIGVGIDSFPTIQEAVDVVTAGGTTHVYAHLTAYVENVTINKSLTLQGEEANPTDVVINPGALGVGIDITAGTTVNISNLQVSNAGTNGIQANGVGGLTLTLTDVQADLNGNDGVFVDGIANLQLTNGEFINNAGNGLDFGSLSGTLTVANATVSGNGGTGLVSVTSGTTTISGGSFDGLDVTDADSITLDTATVASTEAVVLSANNAVQLDASLNAGSATVTISANQDGAGTDAFGMAASTSMTTTNDTASAVSITVNTAGGGTGSATLAVISAGTTAGATGGRVTVTTTGGTILDGNATSGNLTVGNAVLTGAGVATTADPLETGLSNLEADGGAGGVFMANTGALEIGNVGAVTGVSASGGGITVSSSAALTVSEAVTETGGGNIALTAGAGATLSINAAVDTSGGADTGTVTLDAGLDVALDATVSGGGAIFLTADNDVTATANGDVNSAASGVTITADADGTITFAGTIGSGTGLLTASLADADGTVSGVISGSGGFTKNGAGTLTISAANTYSGQTTVAAGTLLVTGSTVAGSNVVVQSGATLGGTGTVNGTVTVNNGGTVAPGLSPGIFNTGSVTFAAGANFDVEVNDVTTAGTDYDQLNVTGTVDVTGATLNVAAGAGLAAATVAGDQIVLISNDSTDAVTGTFAGLPQGASLTLDGANFRIFYTGGDGNDVILIRALAPLTDTYADPNWAGTPAGADPDGAGPALFFQLDSFLTIQEAVNAVDDGGTTHVNAATYAENVSITKNVTLTGSTGTKTDVVIDPTAAGAGITIGAGATDVTIQDLRVTGASTSGINSVGVATLALTVSNVQSDANGDDGIHIEGADSVLINNGSMFQQNNDDGIDIRDTDPVTLNSVSTTDNNADGNATGDGVEVRGVGTVTVTSLTSSGNQSGVRIISAGSFSDTDSDIADNRSDGIRLSDITGNVTLVRTTLNGNNANGDATGSGIASSAGVNAFIIGGNLLLQGITATDGGGQQLRGVSISSINGNVTIEDAAGPAQSTMITGNSVSGVSVTTVTGFVTVTNATISGNTDANNAGSGLFLGSVGDVSITSSSLSSNDLHGLQIDVTAGAVVISGGSFNSANSDGIRITGANSVSVTGSSISSNGAAGLRVADTPTVTIDSATLNGNTNGALDIDNATLLEILTASANNSGGTIDNVATVLFRTGATDDTLNIDGNSFGGGGFADAVYATVTTLNVESGDGQDTVNASPATSAQATVINLFGGDPTTIPGDTLVLDLTGVTAPSERLTGVGSGTVTATSHQTLHYSEFELIDAAAAAPLIPVVTDTGLNANNATADAFRIVQNTTHLEFSLDGTLISTHVQDAVNDVTVTGSGDDDALTVDYSGGVFSLPGGIAYSGNGETTATGDRLTVTGGSIASLTHNLTGSGSGSLDVGSDATLDITYDGLERTDTTGSTIDTLIFNLLANVSDATIADFGTSNDDANQISSTSSAFTTSLFGNPATTFEVNATGGSSVVQLSAMDDGFAPTSFNLSGNAGDTFQTTASEVIPDVSTGTLTTATLELNGNSETIGALAGDGPVTLGAGSLTTGGNDTSTSYSGVISGSGSVIKEGTGIWTLDGASSNAMTGGTFVNDGTLLLSRSGGAIAISGDLTIGDSIGANDSAIIRLTDAEQIADTSSVSLNADGLLDLDGNPETIDSLTSLDNDTEVALGAATGILTVSSGNFGGVISGSGDLVKQNAGTLTLSGTSTYTGATTINGGTLTVNGSIATSSGVTVNSGGTLSGTGTVPGVDVAAGGTVDPGDTVGTLSTGNVTFVSGSTFTVDLVAPTAGNFDSLSVTGTVDLNDATLDVQAVVGFSALLADCEFLKIIDNDGVDPVTGTFNGLPDGSNITIDGVNFRVLYNPGGTSNVYLVRIVDPLLDIYVDDDWTGTAFGEDPDGAGPAHCYGIDAFDVIQDGVDKVSATGTVHVNPGAYPESVFVAKDITIDGTSNIATDVLITPLTGPGIEIAGGATVVISDLSTIDSPDAPGIGSHASGVDLTISNVVTDGNGFSGIDVFDANSVTLTDVTATNNGVNGFIANSVVGTVTVTGGFFNDNTFDGIDIFDSGDVDLDNADTSSNPGHGVVIDNVSSLDVTNVTSNDNGIAGLDAERAANVTISGGTFDGNGSDGIGLDDNGTVEISNLSASQNGGDGISHAGPGNATLNNVTAANNSGNGFSSTATGDIVLNGSSFDGIIVAAANSIRLDTATVTSTETVSLDADNAVTFNSSLNATAATVTVTANQDGAGSQSVAMASGTSITTTNDTADAVSISVNTMAGGTGNANITVINAGTTVGTMGGRVTINTAAGAITDASGAAKNITAGNAVLSGMTGIGTIADPVEMLVSRLEASGGTGGVNILNCQSLQIGGVDAGSVGVMATTGDVRIDVTGSLTVSENVTSTGGNVRLQTIDAATPSESITVNAGVTLSASGNLDILSGDDVTIQATSILSAGGAITMTGDAADADSSSGVSIDVAAQLTSGTGTAINGGSDDDRYTIAYPDGATNSGTVTISDPAGTDSVQISGTAGADTLFLTTTDPPATATTGQVTRGNGTDEPIVIPDDVESVTLAGGGGNDTFNVQPSMLWPVLVDGQPPVFGDAGVPPGDTLILDTLGNTFSIVGKSIDVDGGSPTPFYPVSFVSIESLPILDKSTTTLRLDFNRTYSQNGVTLQTPTQAGFTGVTANTVYSTSGPGYGWDTPLGAFSDTANTVAAANLVNDGHVFNPSSGAVSRTFSADVSNGWVMVTVSFGNPQFAVDGMQLVNADTGAVIGNNLSTPAGTTSQISVAVRVDDGTLNLAFSDPFGPNRLISVNGIDIEPLEYLTLGLTGPTGPLNADGVSIDTYTVYGPASSLVTIDPDPGTIVTADADPLITGFQILTDSAGEATVEIRRPTVPGTSIMLLSLPTGGEFGCLGVLYGQANNLKFDFNTNQSPTFNPISPSNLGGYIGVVVDDLYSGSTGYGWLEAPNNFRTVPSLGGAQADLIDDGHRNSVPGTFRVDVQNGTYEVHAVIGDIADHEDLNIAANGLPVVTGLMLGEREIFEAVFSVTVSSGRLDLTFSTSDSVFFDGHWIVNAIELRQGAVVESIAFGASIGDVPADGMTISTISASSTIAPGGLVTVETSRGTIVTPDADATLTGHQITVGAGGAISFDLRSPTDPGTPTISLHTIDGSHNATVSNAAFLNFTGPDIRRFDFNQGSTAATTSPTEPGYISVRNNNLSPETDGFGWVSGVNTFFKSGDIAGVTTDDLYRDGHSGGVGNVSTFKIQAAAATTYDLRVAVGNTRFETDGIRLTVEGSGVQIAPETGFGRFTTVTFLAASDQNADGFVSITVTDSGGIYPTGWGIAGIDISATGLPPAAPLTATQSAPAGTAPILTSAALDTAVELVTAAFSQLDLTAAQRTRLASVEFVISNLNPGGLGLAGSTNILIDDDAAGLGWSLSPTAVAAGRYDLLTVLAHELGHALGFEHADNAPTDVMSETLAPGDRHTALGAIDNLFAAPLSLLAFE